MLHCIIKCGNSHSSKRIQKFDPTLYYIILYYILYYIILYYIIFYIIYNIVWPQSGCFKVDLLFNSSENDKSQHSAMKLNSKDLFQDLKVVIGLELRSDPQW